ncbi:hypothetical protein SARC_10713 [Sphaeroforma arctica JP610]|uniref:GH18 domain-containing protein n=1 Tax=Sphaeroforma arctica JP610 TaxID=667725 RepID=A0A0L0FJZ0_9EUKA|nr:hypothetical protein SARC_10713 [Sphaeroforma arctica JP610]KNC76806.1 hypothetical protein SARC_10713 [Sphaeroforma arctica JP610]|eukprot:XP_014150708.1 hypothetical protein SARC_10713 [Sphaeroforma arctica JP610]
MLPSLATIAKFMYNLVPVLNGGFCVDHLLCCSGSTVKSDVEMRQTPPLSDKLIVGYASWKQCDDYIITAVENGINVVVWFSINLAVCEGEQTITGAVPDLDCVARTVATLRARGYDDVVHMISVGGWNSPLPDTTYSGQSWFKYFHKWNNEVVARPQMGWHGFDGIDWDPEGSNDVSLPSNHFTVARMDLIGEMSVAAKRAGYLVSLAPAQSYLDMSMPDFDLNVDHAPTYWMHDFKYHGLNTYAYWLARYGHTIQFCGATVATFDWVGLQLYEGWSRANYELSHEGKDVTQYLTMLITGMRDGWEVQFENVPGLETKAQTISVTPSRLLIGLANGWTTPYTTTDHASVDSNEGEQETVPKFLLLLPEQLEKAYQAMPVEIQPRGFMFWNIADEGEVINQATGERLFMAKGLNKFLQVREKEGV